MDWLTWLNTNSGAVIALASAAVVVITPVYAYFTLLLWRAMRTQAEITRLARPVIAPM